MLANFEIWVMWWKDHCESVQIRFNVNFGLFYPKYLFKSYVSHSVFKLNYVELIVEYSPWICWNANTFTDLLIFRVKQICDAHIAASLIFLKAYSEVLISSFQNVYIETLLLFSSFFWSVIKTMPYNTMWNVIFHKQHCTQRTYFRQRFSFHYEHFNFLRWLWNFLKEFIIHSLWQAHFEIATLLTWTMNTYDFKYQVSSVFRMNINLTLTWWEKILFEVTN